MNSQLPLLGLLLVPAMGVTGSVPDTTHGEAGLPGRGEALRSGLIKEARGGSVTELDLHLEQSSLLCFCSLKNMGSVSSEPWNTPSQDWLISADKKQFLIERLSHTPQSEREFPICRTAVKRWKS